jgi:uncharacterized RDD family membrane protein YckC
MEEQIKNTEQENNQDNSELATRGKRLAAAIIDIIIFLPLVIIIARPLGLIDFEPTEAPPEFDLEQTIQLFIISQVLFLLVQGYLLHTRGQSIGKVILKTRIVAMDGKMLGLGKLYFIRYFVFSLIAQIPVIGATINICNILFIFGKEQRCLHDRLAGTKVIDLQKST